MSSFIERLPNELGVVIFSFLGKQDLSICCRICKKCQQIASDKELWKKIAAENNKESVCRESVGSLIGGRIVRLKGEGYTNEEIRRLFDNEYRKMKGRLPFTVFV